jgi:hypothetical protein
MEGAVLQTFSLKRYRGKHIAGAENQLQKWRLLWFLSLFQCLSTHTLTQHEFPTAQGISIKKGYERNVALVLG